VQHARKFQAEEMHEQRVVALDGVRGLAALGVVLPHYLMMTKWQVNICESVSIIAVEIFFVLSGFVLARQIVFCLSGQTRFLLPVFFLRRWMRTLPPYILALTIMGILTGHLFDEDFFQHLFFVQNLFSINDAQDFFAPAWSLSVEEWFYVAFPLYLAVISYLRCSIGFSAFLFVLIFFVAKVAGLLTGTEHFSVVRRLVMFRLDSICFGFILFIGLSWLHERKRPVVGGIAVLLLIASALALIAIFKQIGDGHRGLPQLIFFYLVAVFGASLIAVAFACEPLVRKIRAVTWTATWLGRLSYDMYLFHFALIVAIFGAGGSFFGGILGYFILLSALCGIVYYFFERPILAARPGYGPRISSAGRKTEISELTFTTLFLEAVWSKWKYWFPTIVAITAVGFAMVAVGEQTTVVDFAYALF
jgi:peptidoglycan/LPS O-acetylase OafA/YrhL